MFKFNDYILGNTGKLVVRKGDLLTPKTSHIYAFIFDLSQGIPFDPPMTGKAID